MSLNKNFMINLVRVVTILYIIYICFSYAGRLPSSSIKIFKGRSKMQIQFSERELEDFLCQKGNLKKYLGLTFISRQIKIDPMGIIDILAFDKCQKCWVIIELKQNMLDKNAIIQGLSYLNFYKTISNYKDRVLNSSKREFKLLLIGQNLDSDIKKVIHNYEGCFSEEWDIYYKLFSCKFDEGINFDFYNIEQKKIEQKLYLINNNKSYQVKLNSPIYNRCIPYQEPIGIL